VNGQLLTMYDLGQKLCYCFKVHNAKSQYLVKYLMSGKTQGLFVHQRSSLSNVFSRGRKVINGTIKRLASCVV
jgi:hypothetical protein